MIKSNDLIANSNIHAGSKNIKAASVGPVMSTPLKITQEATITLRKERAQLDAGLKTTQEPSSVTPINLACSFKSLVESLSVDLHINDMCTNRLPCGARGRMHESNEGHLSDSSSRKLMDEVVNTVNHRRRVKRKK